MKKRSKSDFIVLILLGVMVMIIAMPTGKKTNAGESETQETQTQKEIQNEDEYKESLERQLETILQKMDGVGRAKVMLTLADEGSKQLDKDVTKEEKKTEETTVIYDTGSGKQPYVVKRQLPQVEGVVVVAQGGGDAAVVTQISNAVMSLFHLEAHKVVVVKMSVQEE